MKSFSTFITVLLFLNIGAVGVSFAQKYTIHSIAGSASYLEDPNHKIKIDELLREDTTYKFQICDSIGFINFDVTYSAYWLKIPVHKIPSTHSHIELSVPYLDEVKFYQITEEKNIIYSHITGDDYPFSNRPIQVSSFVFPVNHKAEGTIYIQARCLQPFMFFLRSWKEDDFLVFTQDFNVIQGLYFGFMVLIFLYNLFIYFTTRELMYLVYVMYVMSVTLFTSFMIGYSFEYLWPNTPVINKYFVVTAGLTQIFAVYFTKLFLKTTTLSKFLRLALNFYIGWGVLVMLLTIIDYQIEGLVLAQLGIATLGIMLLIAGIFSYRKGYSPAKYYLLAWGLLTFGFVLDALEAAGLISNIYLNNIQIGSSLEVLFLSFALGDKLNTLKKEREIAQKEALEASQLNEKIIKEQNIILDKKVKERTEELSVANEEMQSLNEELNITLEIMDTQAKAIQKAHEQTQASINYAQRIQEAMLPDIISLKTHFQEVFVLYRPRDIVSGDFYWFARKEDETFLVVADCTGHGVPGGFMSMLGIEVFTELVTNNSDNTLGDLLKLADAQIRKLLRQDTGGNRDGIDMTICRVNHQEQKLSFAGAKNPLVIVENKQVTRIKGSSYSIGGNRPNIETEYKTHYFSTQNKKFYLFSDGYQDQIGGVNKTKYMSKRFRNLLLEVSALDMETQKVTLQKALDQWMSESESKQIDDILVVGFEV